MTGDGFDLDGPWRAAVDQITRILGGEIDPRDLILPGGECSTIGIERYAREYVAASGRASLSMIYAIASVGVCTATQGAWALQLPLKGGGVLDVPPAEYACGIAQSGYRKSTALDAARRPLARALEEGKQWRIERLAELRRNGERTYREHADEGDGARLDNKQFNAVFTAGVCPTTIVKDPTMEGLGQMLANNGGVGAIWSAEADVYRNLTAFNSDGGTLTPLLDGWSGEGMSTIRVGRGVIEIPEVALNMIVLMQPEVFADVTGGAAVRGGGSDSFVNRGVFGRTWVFRAEAIAGYERLAQMYADDADFEAHGPDGMCDADGTLSPLGSALADYEGVLKDLVRDSNVFRMNRALHRAWTLAMIEYGADLQVPEPAIPEKHLIYLLKADDRLAYRRVQRMQLAIEAALNQPSVDEDVRDVFMPLVARFTQHVMREALVVSLGAGYRTVSAARILDAATRIIPWRIASTADALLTRAMEVSAGLLRESHLANPSGTDLSTEGIVRTHLARLVAKNPTQRTDGFTRGDVRLAVKGALKKPDGSASISRLVETALETLAGRPDSGVIRTPDTKDNRGALVRRYTMELAAADRFK